MEKRILLAFTLSFVVFVVYMRMFAPRPEDIPIRYPEAETTAPAEREAEESLAGPQREEVKKLESRVEEAVEGEVVRASAELSIEIETPLYRAVVSNRGGNLRSFILKHYQNEVDGPYEMVPQEGSRRLGSYPLDMDLESPEATERVHDALFQTSSDPSYLLYGRSGSPGQNLRLGEEESATLEFVWADGRGLEVMKRIGFHGSLYVLDVQVTAKQNGNEIRKRLLYGPGVGDVSRTGSYAQPDKGIIRVGEEIRFYAAGDIDDGEGASVDVAAVGVASHYFAGLMMPPRGSGYGARLTKQSLEPENGNGKKRDYITAALEVPAEALSLHLFIGPKEHDRLAALAPGMERVIDYGSWMRYLALPLRSALLWIHEYVGNFGWSIVALTILINVALIPLKHHSYVSMRKMQKLAPQIKKIQERYKKLKPTDPRQQDKNREVMELYRAHNVSPVSGCLPMLLMIPFFFAFYRLLMVSIELRHAPFLLWIKDLSTYDPYFILPILMGVTQIAIQKMSPQTSADPVQGKIMMMMPVMFIFILAWAPAGLVLYWFVNNLVSIGQQTITNRLLDEQRSGEDATDRAGGKSRKSKKKAVTRS